MNFTPRQTAIIYLIICFLAFLLGGLFMEPPQWYEVNQTITVECIKGWNQTNITNDTKYICGFPNPLRLKEYDLNLSYLFDK